MFQKEELRTSKQKKKKKWKNKEWNWNNIGDMENEE